MLGRMWMAAAVVMAGTAAIAQTASQATASRRAAEDAMLKADRAFNRAVADGDRNRFLSLVAEDATFGANRGREAIGQSWAPFFAPEGPRLTWAPTKAESLVAGDVGYTIGSWERRTRNAGGAVTVTHGQYLTVWQKQKDGSWQAAFDTGSTAPESAITSR